MPRPIIGCDREIARWVGSRLGIDDFGQYVAIGIVHADDLIAGIVYNNHRAYFGRSHDIDMTIASTDPAWCSRTILSGLFAYPFRQLGCRRVTAVTRVENAPARRFLVRLGFREEGVLREALPTGNAAIYGMLAEECRWLRNADARST